MDKRHFARFYEQYFERIYKFVFFRVEANKQKAQDLTQDVFVKAFEAFDRYDPVVSKTAWLYTIARNHLINEHARSRPGVSLEEIEGMLIVTDDAQERFLRSDDEKRLWNALRQLETEDARLVRMKYLEGWSFAELEKELGKASGALRVQAGRALKKLRQLMNNPYV